MLSDALRQVSMIAEIDTSALGMTRTDKEASRDANTHAHARTDAGRVVVQRFAGADELPKRIMDLQKEAHDNLKRVSTQWGAGKRRLLPNANFQGWISAQRDIQDKFNLAVSTFIDKSDEVLAQARSNLGNFKVDLPTKKDIEESYSLSYQLEPIPDGAQFQGSAEVETYLREQFEANIAASVQEARQDALRRLADPLSKLVERMDAYNKREVEIASGKDPGKTGIFRDSVVENLKEVSKVFASFNVLGDPKLTEISRMVEAFNKIDADILRKRGDIRTAAAERAKEVLSQLDDLLVR